ncbi:hypothetical protein ABZ070_05810 [Streptomyces sp. NPDC006283]|uniref:hypothetical protein n=1 Tax=Streptomyces sp. NPDC006283 TaxID=3156741 RepID=UPI00339E4163
MARRTGGSLAFTREPCFVCVVNLSPEPYRLPRNESVLPADGPVRDGLPAPDHAVRLALRQV